MRGIIWKTLHYCIVQPFIVDKTHGFCYTLNYSLARPAIHRLIPLKVSYKYGYHNVHGCGTTTPIAFFVYLPMENRYFIGIYITNNIAT